jgi:hypothetical protein
MGVYIVNGVVALMSRSFPPLVARLLLEQMMNRTSPMAAVSHRGIKKRYYRLRKVPFRPPVGRKCNRTSCSQDEELAYQPLITARIE